MGESSSEGDTAYVDEFRKKLVNINYKKSMLVTLSNRENKAATGFMAWLSKAQEKIIQQIIDKQKEIEVYWPDLDYIGGDKASLKKQLTTAMFEKEVVRVHAVGDWPTMKESLKNMEEHNKLDVSKNSRKVVKAKVKKASTVKSQAAVVGTKQTDNKKKGLLLKKYTPKVSPIQVQDKVKSLRSSPRKPKPNSFNMSLPSTSSEKVITPKENNDVDLNAIYKVDSDDGSTDKENDSSSEADDDLPKATSSPKSLPSLSRKLKESKKTKHMEESEEESDPSDTVAKPKSRVKSSGLNPEKVRSPKKPKLDGENSFLPDSKSTKVLDDDKPKYPLLDSIIGNISKGSVAQYTNGLLANIFSRSYMAAHSITGKPPNCNRTMKVAPAIEKGALDYIYDKVCFKFGRQRKIITRINKTINGYISGCRNLMQEKNVLP